MTTLLLGDCLDQLKTLPDNSVDSVVTDPPYGLSKEPDIAEVMRHWINGDRYEHKASGFMGKSWDSFVPGPEYWREVIRVLKPGGHAAVFAGTRTQDLMTVAMRFAGFEIRDSLAWNFGSGFPKSLSVHKATLKLTTPRYGNALCDCVDGGDEVEDRNDAGREGGENVRAPRELGAVSEGEARDSAVPLAASPGADAVLDVQPVDDTPTTRHTEVEEPVLLEGVREQWTEEARHGHAAVRAGMEGREDGCSSQGCELPVVQQNTGGERESARSPSPQAVPIRRIKQPDEPGSALRELPPQGRGSDGAGASFDPDRRDARRVIPDDYGRWDKAVARVCSWCGLPDRAWLESLKPLGTATKPAHEPIILARKPLLASTVAANVQKFGTGALNIEACRVAGESTKCNHHGGTGDPTRWRTGNGSDFTSGSDSGRWPSNLLLTHSASCEQVGMKKVKTGDPRGADGVIRSKANDIYGKRGEAASQETNYAGPDGTETVPAYKCAADCPVRALDAQSGKLKTHGGGHGEHEGSAMFSGGRVTPANQPADVGGASRFFPQLNFDPEYDAPFLYCAKASRKERNEGTNGMPQRMGLSGALATLSDPRMDREQERRPQANHHPTVKPVALMRWLCRLITPPGGTILDPFTGSGTTGVAATLEGFSFIGIEREPEYMEIARARINHADTKTAPPDLFSLAA